MNSITRVLALIAATGASLIVTTGLAQAAGDFPFGPDGQDTHSETKTFVHSSGPGGTAVNATGGGSAGQYAYQQKPDGSTHENTDFHPSTDSHNSENSHNVMITRSSENMTYPGFPNSGFGN